MKKILYTLFSFLSLWASLLHAEIHIEITQGIDSPYPIGVLPFHWKGNNNIAVPEDISNIIFSDLRNSGKFNPLDRSLLPQKVSTAREIQPEMWSSLGINMIVMGCVSSTSEGSYKVTYQLIDTNKTIGTVLVQNSYKITKKWLRYAGHAISNEIFEKLTGIKGAFCTRIAYVVHTKNSYFPYELRVSDYDGHNQFVVHQSTQPLMSPTWSPKGDKLAYVTFEGGNSSLVIQTLADGKIHQIASFPNHNGAPAFSPDGTKIAFALSKTGSLNLYVMEINSGKIRQITNNYSNNTEPSWFPDSKHLAYTSDQESRPQIYKVNIYNGISKRITWEGLQNQNADISSDGKFMVMVSSNNGKQYITKQDLLTGNVQTLSSSSFLDETPSLAPNDTMVIYASSQEIGSTLNIVSIDGGYRSRILEIGSNVKFPSWSPYL